MANIDDSTFESVNNTNFKVFGEMQAANALSHQNRVNVIAEQGLAQFVKTMVEVDPTESRAVQGVLTGHATADTLAQLGSTIAGLQQLVKTAQTTPPPTA